MDGIFGVGIAEMVLIALAILIIGGPRNALKWSRELGRFVRQSREFISGLMRELEDELGEDGKEVMSAAREFRSNVDDVRRQANPRHLINQAGKLLDDTAQEAKHNLQAATEQSPSPPSQTPPPRQNDRYRAWSNIPEAEPTDANPDTVTQPNPNGNQEETTTS